MDLWEWNMSFIYFHFLDISWLGIPRSSTLGGDISKFDCFSLQSVSVCNLPSECFDKIFQFFCRQATCFQGVQAMMFTAKHVFETNVWKDSPRCDKPTFGETRLAVTAVRTGAILISLC